MKISLGFLSFVSRFALAGAACPLFLSILWWFVNNASRHSLTLEIVLEKITLSVWPSALALTVGAGFGNQTFNLKLFLIALIANVILYGILGAGVWLGLRKHRAILALVLCVVVVIEWRLLSL